MWAIIVCYALRVGAALHTQVTADVFFLDWEPPKANPRLDEELGKRRAAAAAVGATAPPAAAAPAATVSAWRSIFAAHEWASLATKRRAPVAVTMAVLVALLEGGRLKFVATPQPALTLAAGALNPVLAFANTTFWYWLVVAAQYLWGALLWERFWAEDPCARFVDLCTVMKVSVLLMDQRYRGFYIHGNAPHEFADGSMSDVTRHLFEEACNMRAGRGIAGCPEPHCQTFELHVPRLWREQYERVYRRLLDANAAMLDAAFGPGGALGRGALGGDGRGGAAPPAAGGAAAAAPTATSTRLSRAVERTRTLAEGHAALSAFLRGFVEESDPEFKRVWRDRSVLMSLLDLPPDLEGEASVVAAGASMEAGAGGGGGGGGGAGGGGGDAARLTYLYTDAHHRFEALVFRGIELDLCCFEGLLFCLVDSLLGYQPATAGAIVFAVATALSYARAWLGRRNVAYTALVEESLLPVSFTA
jgi:hypothetical protein